MRGMAQARRGPVRGQDVQRRGAGDDLHDFIAVRVTGKLGLYVQTSLDDPFSSSCVFDVNSASSAWCMRRRAVFTVQVASEEVARCWRTKPRM